MPGQTIWGRPDEPMGWKLVQPARRCKPDTVIYYEFAFDTHREYEVSTAAWAELVQMLELVDITQLVQSALELRDLAAQAQSVIATPLAPPPRELPTFNLLPGESHRCQRSACGAEIGRYMYRIWNNPTEPVPYRDYCVKCGRRIIELNAQDAAKAKCKALHSQPMLVVRPSVPPPDPLRGNYD